MMDTKDRILQRLLEASAPAKVVAKALSSQGSNNFVITVNDKGQVLISNTKGANLSPSAIAFNVDGGHSQMKKSVESAVRGVKSSKELAKKLNDSNLGFTNWKPVSLD